MDKQLVKTANYETEETLDRLKTFLNYNPETGDIVFTDTRFGAVEIGQKAGGVDSNGYHRIYHRGRLYMGHRIAWALFYNEWPKGTIDHINGCSYDNRIENLRVCTNSENMMNRKPYSGSIFKGVYNRDGVWRTIITSGGVQYNLGRYNCLGQALKAYDAKAKDLHGEYARLNLPKG